MRRCGGGAQWGCVNKGKGEGTTMMLRQNTNAKTGLLLSALALIVIGAGGCPLFKSDDASLTVLFTGDGQATQKALLQLVDPSLLTTKSGPVNVDDIAELWLTITEIELDRAGSSHDGMVEVLEAEFDPTTIAVGVGDTVTWEWTFDGFHTVTSGTADAVDAGELFDGVGDNVGDTFEVTFNTAGLFAYFSDTDIDIAEGMSGAVEVVEDAGNGDDSDDQGSKITVFSGERRVNILDLIEVSEVLSSVDVPAGRYTKIRLSVEDPLLVFEDETETTNIKLTANGRLFVSKTFELPEGNSVLLLDFGGIHLVETGNSGRFVLTPQLRAELNITSADVTLTGIIRSFNNEGTSMVVTLDDGRVLVVIGDAVITDLDLNQLTPGDLYEEQEVIVTGTLFVDGSVAAGTIEIQESGGEGEGEDEEGEDS